MTAHSDVPSTAEKPVALITGGSDGLGKALAAQLIQTHRVVITGRNPDKTRAIADTLGCNWVQLELQNSKMIEQVVETVLHNEGNIDVLINAAGIWQQGRVEEHTAADVEQIMAVNATGAMLMTRAVVGHMKSRGSGSIVMIISRDGKTAKANRSVYHASKWAITGFTQCLRHDLVGSGIGVMAVYPGLMATGIFAKAGALRDTRNSLQPEQVASQIVSALTAEGGMSVTELSLESSREHNPFW